jgi:hypothetical protein
MDDTLGFRLAVVSLLILIAWLMMIAIEQLAALRVPVRAIYFNRRDLDLGKEGA